MSESLTCKNCSKEFKGNYCPNCGQKGNVEITFKTMLRLILDAFEFNRGMLYNLKVILSEPGNAVHDYLDGKTKPYLNPLVFLLFSLSLLTIVSDGLYGDDGSFLENLLEEFRMSVLLITALSIPNYLIFGGKIYSFLQHIVAAIFYTSLLFIIASLMELVGYFFIESNIIYIGMLFIPIAISYFKFQSILNATLIRSIFNLLLSLLIAAFLLYILIESFAYVEYQFKEFIRSISAI